MTREEWATWIIVGAAVVTLVVIVVHAVIRGRQ
jgi:hypothetical protein